MKLLIDLPIEGASCGACPIVDTLRDYRYCAVFHGRVRWTGDQAPMRCSECLEAEFEAEVKNMRIFARGDEA